jgi:hypothetical protein
MVNKPALGLTAVMCFAVMEVDTKRYYCNNQGQPKTCKKE